jgi:maleylpyruvate isomerase
MAGRTDNVTDPELARALLLMRRGQAFWARKLNELRDADFEAPSLLPGWGRRHLVAHVGFNARAVARLVEWARTGIETPMYDSPTQRAEEIAFGATLPVEALRNLAAHAAVHLNVEWRDLPEDAWAHEVRTAQGRLVPVAETVWMRTREVWIHAVDLANGGRVADFPPELVDALLEDLVRVWRRKRADADPDIVLEPLDRQATYSILGSGDGLVVRGSAVDLVGWGIGRASRGVLTAEGEPPPKAPEWL